MIYLYYYPKHEMVTYLDQVKDLLGLDGMFDRSDSVCLTREVVEVLLATKKAPLPKDEDYSLVQAGGATSFVTCRTGAGIKAQAFFDMLHPELWVKHEMSDRVVAYPYVLCRNAEHSFFENLGYLQTHTLPFLKEVANMAASLDLETEEDFVELFTTYNQSNVCMQQPYSVLKENTKEAFCALDVLNAIGVALTKDAANDFENVSYDTLLSLVQEMGWSVLRLQPEKNQNIEWILIRD